MTAVGQTTDMVFEPVIITRKETTHSGSVQKNHHHHQEANKEAPKAHKGLSPSHPKAPKYEGQNPSPSLFRNMESFRQTLGSLKPTMNLERFEALTTKREPAPMTMNLALPGKNNKTVLINDVRYANDVTLTEFVGMALPKGFHQKEVIVNGQAQVVFFTTAQLNQAKGVRSGIIN